MTTDKYEELKTKAWAALKNPCGCGNYHETKTVCPLVRDGKILHPNLTEQGEFICPDKEKT
jgi:hypothetical protein